MPITFKDHPDDEPLKSLSGNIPWIDELNRSTLVVLPAPLYDRAEALGFDMSGYLRQKMISE